MTKSRLFYIALMLLALLVLFWDKFINPHSVTQPQASQAQSTQADATDQPDDVFQWADSPFVQRALKQQKQQQQESHQDFLDRNLFAPSDLFRKKTETPTTAPQEKKLDAELHLTSISKGPDKDQVLINGQIVKIGEFIGHYCLMKINRDEVIFHTNTEHITLPLGDITQPELRKKIKFSPCNQATCLFK